MNATSRFFAIAAAPAIAVAIHTYRNQPRRKGNGHEQP